MSDMDRWSDSATGNQSASPDGFPEGMARSGVNDAAREIMAANKRVYDQPAWKNPFFGYTLARTNGTTWTLTDGGGKTNAAQYAYVNQMVRMVQGGSTWVGHFTSATYSSPTTTLVISWQAHVSADTTGPTAVGTIEVWAESGNVVFRSTGTLAAQVPTNADLDAHTQKTESALDVGELDNHTREELAQAIGRGRINFNGSMVVTNRGFTFDAATTIGGAVSNSGGSVCADGWSIISDGNDRVDIDIQNSDSPAGFDHAIRLEAQSNNYHGVIHCIEEDDCFDVCQPGASQRVSLSFYAKFNSLATGIDRIRVYLLNLTDRFPGTPINAWPGSVGTDFTAGADWQIIASESITITDQWVRYTPTNLTNVDPDVSGIGGNGLAIAFHVDEATISTGAQWLLTGVQLNQGKVAQPFEHWPLTRERERATRYFNSTFRERYANPAGTNGAIAAVSSGTDVAFSWQFPEMYRQPPTLVTVNPRSAAATHPIDDGTNDIAVSSTDLGRKVANIYSTTATDSTVYRVGAYVHANIWGVN